jgi:hypothetical protein
MTLGSCLVYAREVTLNVEYVPITKYGFVADTLNGVESKYNPWGTNYDCGELVRRYYKQVYGLTVSLAWDKPNVTGTDEYWFEVVDEPQTGDVFFASAWERGKSYGHWALCKETDKEADTITMFEQNWRWNGMAGVGRQIRLSKNCYTYYRLTNAEGHVLTLAEKAAKEAQIRAIQNEMAWQMDEEEFLEAAIRMDEQAQVEAIHQAAAQARAAVEQLRNDLKLQAMAAAKAAQ